MIHACFNFFSTSLFEKKIKIKIIDYCKNKFSRVNFFLNCEALRWAYDVRWNVSSWELVMTFKVLENSHSYKLRGIYFACCKSKITIWVAWIQHLNRPSQPLPIMFQRSSVVSALLFFLSFFREKDDTRENFWGTLNKGPIALRWSWIRDMIWSASIINSSG